MIYSNLRNSNRLELVCHGVVADAIEQLRTLDLKSLSKGRHEFHGDGLYLLIQEAITLDRTATKAEDHRNFVDIHCLITGCEIIGFRSHNDDCVASSPYAENIDATLYDAVPNEMNLTMKEGDFAVFFPGDIHRPMCAGVIGPQVIRKAVFKISVNLLK